MKNRSTLSLGSLGRATRDPQGHHRGLVDRRPAVIERGVRHLHAGHEQLEAVRDGDFLGGITGNPKTKISYFINGDATEGDPQIILTGDNSIANGTAGSSGAAPTPSFTTMQQLQPALANTWAWTTDFHSKAGNIALSDGSVQQLSVSTLRTALLASTNSVGVYQFYNFHL